MSEQEQLSLDSVPERDEDAAELVPAPEPADEEPTGARTRRPPSRPAAIEARDRDVFLEAGAGTGKTRVLVDRYCDAIDRRRRRAGADPRLHLHRAGRRRDAPARPGRARAARRRGHRPGAARAAARRGARGRGDADRPRSTASAAACSPPTPWPPASTPASGCSTPRRRPGSPAEAFDGRSPSWPPSDADVVRAAAGYRWRLAGIIRAAHADLRNRGAVSPALPPIQITALERQERRRGIRRAGGGRRTPAPPTTRCAGCSAAYGERYEALCARSLRASTSTTCSWSRSSSCASAARSPRRSGALRPPARRRVPGHEPDPGRAGARALRARRPACSPSATSSSRSTRFRGADLASFRRERERIRERAAAHPEEASVLPAHRQLPLRSRRRRRRQRGRRRAARRLHAAARRPPPRGPAARAGREPAVELLLTRRDGWKRAGEPDPDRAQRRASRAGSPRLASSPSACASWPTAASTRPGWSSCCGRSPTSTSTRRRSSSPGSIRTWSAGAATGRPSRSPTRFACSPASPTRSTTSRCSAPSPRPPAARAPTRSGCCAGSPGAGSHLWPALEDLFRPPPEEPDEPAPDGRREEPDERELERRAQAATWSERLPDADRERLAPLLRAPHRPARATPRCCRSTRWSSGRWRPSTTTSPPCSLDDGRRRTANLRKLVRIATEYEAHDGRDLRGFLDHAAARAAFSDREAEVGHRRPRSTPGCG